MPILAELSPDTFLDEIERLAALREDALKKLFPKKAQQSFSFVVEQGGYLHENGSYTEENTLVLSLIDTDETIINEIAKDLCSSSTRSRS